MRDFSHLRRLLPEEQTVFETLYGAFDRLNDSMRAMQPQYGVISDSDAENLATLIRDLGDALAKAGASEAPHCVAPSFCTRCYESMAWGINAGGSPGATCSAIHMLANAAGVRYSNALCGRR